VKQHGSSDKVLPDAALLFQGKADIMGEEAVSPYKRRTEDGTGRNCIPE